MVAADLVCTNTSVEFICGSHDMGFHTGIDLDELVSAGNYICNVLGKSTQSKTAQAILAARQGSPEGSETVNEESAS